MLAQALFRAGARDPVPYQVAVVYVRRLAALLAALSTVAACSVCLSWFLTGLSQARAGGFRGGTHAGFFGLGRAGRAGCAARRTPGIPDFRAPDEPRAVRSLALPHPHPGHVLCP